MDGVSWGARWPRLPSRARRTLWTLQPPAPSAAFVTPPTRESRGSQASKGPNDAFLPHRPRRPSGALDAFEANVTRGTLGSEEASHSGEAYFTRVTRLAFGAQLPLGPRKPCSALRPPLARRTQLPR